MANDTVKFDSVEMQFYRDAYIALAVHFIDPKMGDKMNLAGEYHWERQLDLAEKIAMQMTGIFQITRECHTMEE